MHIYVYMLMKRINFSLLLLLVASFARAQDDDGFVSINTPLTIDLEANDHLEDVKVKKKRRKKRVFYGVKTRKAYTKTGFGERTTYELFHILKEHQQPDQYVRDIYWYDSRRGGIRTGGKIDPKYGAILHGPYSKRQGIQVIEEGIYYFGTKHGRWVKMDKNDILLDKEKYYKGWPKESLVKYYDTERTKFKEVIPIEYGEKEGNYFYFFENGLIAVRGEYKYGQKVGKWMEYHHNSQRKKKIIQYPADPYEKEFSPYIWREYNKKGRLVYENKTMGKK